MSILAPGIQPDNQLISVSFIQQSIYNAWSIDPSWTGYIYNAWYIMYGLTIVPTFFAMPFILIVKAFVNIYLFVDMVLKALGLGFHPVREAYIWSMDNWWGYSFRRWLVDWLLTPLHFFTQLIPFVNWILNMITMVAYWANVIVF